MKEHVYSVKGMHCAACEVLIEKKLLDLPGVEAVDASTAKGKVVVQYEGKLPGPEALNDLFKGDNYTFAAGGSSEAKKPINQTLLSFTIAIFLVAGFLLLQTFGVGELLNVNATSSLITFFLFGLLAGVSTCAALVGGIVLSLSKQWNELYNANSTVAQKMQPHVLFNTGRVISYGLFGGLLGLIGSQFQLSLTASSWLILVVCLLMLGFGLQMVGVKAFRGFQIALPKAFTRNVANERNFKGKYMPFLMGAATFFLPCGFTITAQALALISGSYISGALIMAAFALGTAPALLAIGLSSVKFSQKPHTAAVFSKVAGFLILFFALFTAGNQLTIVGIPFGGTPQNSGQVSQEGLAPVVDGKQVLAMTVYASEYSPNTFKVKAGMPVKWEVTSSGQPSCNAGAIVSTLFSDTFYLNPSAGAMNVKEFTPTKAGKYQFSCTMGMYRGTIEVID